MAKFILLLRDDHEGCASLGPEEMQRVIQEYVSWGRRVREKGVTLRGEKLRDGHGKVLRKPGDRPRATDGPFAETKEVIGGYYEIEAGTLDDVVRLCADHPQLVNGSIEIREVEAV